MPPRPLSLAPVDPRESTLNELTVCSRRVLHGVTLSRALRAACSVTVSLFCVQASFKLTEDGTLQMLSASNREFSINPQGLRQLGSNGGEEIAFRVSSPFPHLFGATAGTLHTVSAVVAAFRCSLR